MKSGWRILAGGIALAPAARAQPIPIQHVIIIMQENRSFDNYFGTFPGANGFPAGTCVLLNPAKPAQGCVAPFHDVHDVNAGGPHGAVSAQADLDDGISTAKFDGFLLQQIQGKHGSGSVRCRAPGCATSGHDDAISDGIRRHDAMGYHTQDEIANYWAYAQHFVLQDRLFNAVRSWSQPTHIELTSEWVADCTNMRAVSTCTTSPNGTTERPHTLYPWANLFQFLDRENVSWKYYLGQGTEPDCQDDEMTCDPQAQASMVASFWNPAPYYTYVKAQGTAYIAAHNPPLDQFLVDIAGGTLPQVAWIVPSITYSEHAPAGVTAGMEYVTSLVNAVMQSPTYWNNTAIFITWDEWGGFYDHVLPPNVDSNATATPIQGYGLRVPGLMISAWARAGYVDDQLLSFDNYAMLFEALFAGGAHLDPTALGAPDSRPDIRDTITQVSFLDGSTAPVGNLLNEFDFTQTPLPPLVLSTHIPTGLVVGCRNNPVETSDQCQLPTVTLAWQPVTSAQVPGPFTYHILRDGNELAQCVGTATSCTDMPAAGAHLYQAYSVDGSGTASPVSAAAEADVK